MDSQVGTLLKAVLAGLGTIIGIMFFLFIFQLAQIQNFQQYSDGVISRQGGLTAKAINDIEQASITKYNNNFHLVDKDGSSLRTIKPGKNGKDLNDYTYKYTDYNQIKRYGETIPYYVKFKAAVGNGSKGFNLALPIVQTFKNYSSSKNRDNDAHYTDGNLTINDDYNLKPSNSVITVSLSNYPSDPTNKNTDDYNLNLLLGLDRTSDIQLTGIQTSSAQDGSIVGLSSVSGVIKPRKLGSASVTFSYKDPKTGSVKYTPNYTVVVTQ